MLRKIWSALKYYLFLGVGIVLLYIVFRDVDFARMWNEIKAAHYGWLGLSFLFGLLAMISRAQRWLIVLEPMGYSPGLLNSFTSVSMGYFANIAFPRMGEVVRCTTLNQTNKIPVNQLLGTVVVERVIDVLMLLGLIMAVIVAQFGMFGNFFMEKFGEKTGGIKEIAANNTGVWLLVLLLLLLGAGLFLGYYLLKRFGHTVPVKRIRSFMQGIGDGFIALFKIKRKAAFVFHTLFIWFNYFLMTWVCLFAYPPTSGLAPVDGLFLMVIGGLGMTAPVPGGVGSFHYFVAAALGLYHLDENTGVTFATLVHSTQFIMTVCAGLFAFVVLLLFKRRNNASTPV